VDQSNDKLSKMSGVLYLLAWISISVLVVPGDCSTLYGYYNTPSSSGLVSIDPTTGASKTVCDLSHLPQLLGASGSSYPGANTLFFYTIDDGGNISLVELDPLSCKSTTIPITGLSSGQNDVRDIKFDRINNKLYMVFPNPNCLHGSLEQVDIKTGAAGIDIANVIDPVGLAQTAGLLGQQKGGKFNSSYFYIAIPFGAEDVTYQLNEISLIDGNITSVNMANNALDIGDMWSTNFTLNVVDGSSSGIVVIGAISPPSTTTVKQCLPSGFFTINPKTGDSACAYGPIPYDVYPLAEYDPTTLYFYQLFTDQNYAFYLSTYNTQTSRVLYTVSCKACSQISVLSVL